ncbi:MAG: hypothetical protein AAFU03_04825, partial [Bacteroidota bacterium]
MKAIKYSLLSLLIVFGTSSLMGQNITVHAEVTGVWFSVSAGDCSSCDGADMVWRASSFLYLGNGLAGFGSQCVVRGSQGNGDRNRWHNVNNSDNIFDFTTSGFNIDLCNQSNARLQIILSGYENDCSDACTYNGTCNLNWGGGDDHFGSRTLDLYWSTVVSDPGENNARTREYTWDNQNGSGQYKIRIRYWYTIDTDASSVLTITDLNNDAQTIFCDNEQMKVSLARYNQYNNGYVEWEKSTNNGSFWSDFNEGQGLYSITVPAESSNVQYRARTIHNNSGSNRCIGEFSDQSNSWATTTSLGINVIEGAPSSNQISANATASCKGEDNGKIRVGLSGAQSGLSYSVAILNENGTVYDGNSVAITGADFPYEFTNIAPGTYDVQVVRGAGLGCPAFRRDVTVQERNLPRISTIEIQSNETCFGANDG